MSIKPEEYRAPDTDTPTVPAASNMFNSVRNTRDSSVMYAFLRNTLYVQQDEQTREQSGHIFRKKGVPFTIRKLDTFSNMFLKILAVSRTGRLVRLCVQY